VGWYLFREKSIWYEHGDRRAFGIISNDFCTKAKIVLGRGIAVGNCIGFALNLKDFVDCIGANFVCSIGDLSG